MKTALENADPRSPKRLAKSPRPSFDNEALDAAVWTKIIEFIPIPTDLSSGNRLKYDAKVSEIVATWRTLRNLRLVNRELETLLHPVQNAALWRKLVLQSFDFSVGTNVFNPENHVEDLGLWKLGFTEPDEEQDDEEEASNGEEGDDEGSPQDKVKEVEEEEGEEKEEGPSEGEEEEEEDPQVVAMRGRGLDTGWHLEEDLQNWCKLGIYHCPSEYGFLTELQDQPMAEELWPESEHAFTLFGDLVRLLQLPHGDGMGTGGESSGTTFKYLAAPTEAD